MTLSNCELIPSVIYDTNDPLKLGRIKCVVPGFIDNSTMSLENMPWVRPLDMGRHQSFSKAVKGFKVWVLINKANYSPSIIEKREVICVCVSFVLCLLSFEGFPHGIWRFPG